jgi:hypothetical protein
MTATHSGKQWTTNKSPHATYGAPYAQSDAPTKNHQYDHTDEANASAARKGTPMASIYEIEKQVEAIIAQTRILCELMGIDPTPMPGEEPTVETIEELTDPDA